MRNTILLSFFVFFVTAESFAGSPPGYATLASVASKTGNVLLAKVESSTESKNNANGRILRLVIKIEDGLVGQSPTEKTLKCCYEEYKPSFPAHPHQSPIFTDYTGSGNEFGLKDGHTYIFMLASLSTDKTEAKLLRVEPVENKDRILAFFREVNKQENTAKTTVPKLSHPITLVGLHVWRDGGSLGFELADSSKRPIKFVLDGGASSATRGWFFLNTIHKDYGNGIQLPLGGPEEKKLLRYLTVWLDANFDRKELEHLESAKQFSDSTKKEFNALYVKRLLDNREKAIQRINSAQLQGETK